MISIPVLILAAALQSGAQSRVTLGTTSLSLQEQLHGVAVPTKSRLRALLKRRRNAEDERQIAAYYLSQAQHYVRQAKEEQDIADTYANRALFEPKTAYPEGLLGHYRKLSYHDSQQATKFGRLALLHERLAEE